MNDTTKITALKLDIQDAWNVACHHDGIDPSSKFVVFSPDNPAARRYNDLMIEYGEVTRRVFDRYEVGQEVIARFTNSNRIVEFKGRIIGKTKNYWKVESLEAGVQGWPAGHMFHVATLGSRIYSQNNQIVNLWVR